jgi:hypothetical protein
MAAARREAGLIEPPRKAASPGKRKPRWGRHCLGAWLIENWMRCRLWVIRIISAMSAMSPLYPQRIDIVSQTGHVGKVSNPGLSALAALAPVGRRGGQHRHRKQST